MPPMALEHQAVFDAILAVPGVSRNVTLSALWGAFTVGLGCDLHGDKSEWSASFPNGNRLGVVATDGRTIYFHKEHATNNSGRTVSRRRMDSLKRDLAAKVDFSSSNRLTIYNLDWVKPATPPPVPVPETADANKNKEKGKGKSKKQKTGKGRKKGRR